MITLADTTLEVAEACSGIRSLQALLALGAVYGYFTQRAVWKRWALLLLSIPIAIAANALRVSGTGFLAHYFGSEMAQGFYHSFAGWIVFVAAFFMLLGCGALLTRFPDGKAAAGASAVPPEAKAAGSTARWPVAVALTLMVLTGLLLWLTSEGRGGHRPHAVRGAAAASSRAGRAATWRWTSACSTC